MTTLNTTGGYVIYHGLDRESPPDYQRQQTTPRSSKIEAVTFVMEKLSGDEQRYASIEGPDGTIQYAEIVSIYEAEPRRKDIEDLVGHLIKGAESSPPFSDQQVVVAVDEILVRRGGDRVSLRLDVANAFDERAPNTETGIRHRKLVREGRI